jgi:hypothetical protein
VATLLTGLQSSIPSGAGKTALDYLNDTMTAYSNFRDLERYRHLLAKAPDQRTPAESDLMQRLEANEVLEPYITAMKAAAGGAHQTGP